MAQLKQAADGLAHQIDDDRRRRTAPTVIAAIEGRKAELLGSAYYAQGHRRTPRRASSQRIDQTIARVGTENQIALIREIGAASRRRSTRRCSTSSLASPQGGRRRRRRPPKQTVSVKTITVAGVAGVLETEEDVDGTSPPSVARSSRL